MTTYSVSGPTVVLVGNGTDQYGNLLVADCTDPITGARGPVIVKITNTSNSAVASLQWGDGTVPTYYFDNVSGTGGTGSNATFDFTVTSSNYSATVDSGGAGYTPGDTITVLGTDLGGAAPTNNATVTVVTADVLNAVANIGNLSGGTGYNTGTDIATSGGTGSGFLINVDNVTPVLNSVVSLFGGSLVPGTGYTTGFNYQTTTSGSGTGCELDITASPVDQVATLDNGTLVAGTGYITQGGASTTTSGTGINAFVNIVANPLNAVSAVDNTSLVGGSYYRLVGTQTLTTSAFGGASGLTLDCTSTFTDSILTFDNASLVPGTGYPATGTNVPTTLLGPTPAGYIAATVDFTAAGIGAVNSVTINSGGQGYTVGDTIQINDGNNDATIQVLTTDTGGVITSATVVAGGKNYSPGQTVNINGTNPGAGGATIDVLTTTGLGEITSVSIPSPTGSGYQPGDTLFIDGGNNDASIDVLTVTSVGAIEGYSVQSGGSGYQPGDTLFITGGNNDASINVQTVNPGGVIDQVSLSTTLGQNYQVGDVLTISGGNNNATVEVTEVTLGGQIQTVSVTGTQLWPQQTVQQTYMAPGSTEYVQINGQTAVDSFFIGNAASGVIYITPVTIVG